MRLDLKHCLLLFVICGIILAWFVDRRNLQQQLTAKNQSLSIKRNRTNRPPVLGFYVEKPHEPTDVDVAAAFLYRDVADANSVHDIVRAYKRSKKFPSGLNGQFALLAKRILEGRFWDCFAEIEEKMKEHCVEAPSDRQEFARFLGLAID